MGLLTIREATPAPPPPEPVDLGSTAAAVTLARELAGLLDTPIAQTWWALCNVPDNMLVLLDSPQGWSALAGYIACDLGLPASDYMPGVH